MVEEELGSTSGKQEEWRGVASSLDEVLGKESQTITEGFPLDCENRRLDLETVRRRFQKRQDASAALNDLVEYKSKYLRMGSDLQIVKQTVLPNDGKSRLLSICPILVMCLLTGWLKTATSFLIRQSGKLGIDRYRIDKI